MNQQFIDKRLDELITISAKKTIIETEETQLLDTLKEQLRLMEQEHNPTIETLEMIDEIRRTIQG